MIGQRKISSFFKVASIKSVPKRQLSGDKSIEGHELDDQVSKA